MPQVPCSPFVGACVRQPARSRHAGVAIEYRRHERVRTVAGVGYYGFQTEAAELDEAAPMGTGFLASEVAPRHFPPTLRRAAVAALDCTR